MKVFSVPPSNYDLKANQGNVNPGPSNPTPPIPKDKVSFGSIGESVVGKTAGLFKFIEKNGFFVEFLIVDTVSMIIPRILVGLNRDKNKTGKWNGKAAAEEAGREIMSGPSMNLIPMGMLALACKFMPAVHMEKGTLTSFNEHMKKIAASGANVADKEAMHKDLAGRFFDDAFGKFKFKEGQAAAFREEFVSKLTEATKLKPKSMFPNIVDDLRKIETPYKKAEKEFAELVSKIHNSCEAVLEETKQGDVITYVEKAAKAPINKSAIEFDLLAKDGKLKRAGTSAANVFEDFHNFSKDILERLSTTKDDAAKFLDKTLKSRLAVKAATAVTAFFAVGTFLLYLPKLYQQGKISPAEESARRARLEAEKANAVQGGTDENK